MTEILAPAGNLETALCAIDAGADAVYLGYGVFSARDGAENFTSEDLSALLTRAKALSVKVYLAMNTVVKEEELERFCTVLSSLYALGVDAVILQDVLLGKALHERYPYLNLHLSTQAGVCSVSGAEFAKRCGFSRVILARETPIVEIEKITKIIETEVFVQGALCTAFSGECYLSSFAGGNSGNRGKCKQPCRKRYAYNRSGYDELSYALSLSDLCVGEDVQKLIAAGVSSLKIEGRMRRSEYVAAAVRYYRALIDGTGGESERLSDLKRAYNRGNYTRGLAFGQDKRFLSTAVQGHIGEKVGVVKVEKGAYLVESTFVPTKTDAFKILRQGKEVGGATVGSITRRGFTITSKERLKNGDGVFVTSDGAAKDRALSGKRAVEIEIDCRFEEGGFGTATCGEITVQTDSRLAAAANAPLTEQEVKTAFMKTDGLPFVPTIRRVEMVGKPFLQKSGLNALRRALYAKLTAVERRDEFVYQPFEIKIPQGKNAKTAVILSSIEKVDGCLSEIVVIKQQDWNERELDLAKSCGKEVYLYYPCLVSSKDETAFAAWLSTGAFAGIYVENYGGIVFAERCGVRAFLGTGLNLSNSVAVTEAFKIPCVSYVATSKELTKKEGQPLVGSRVFTLACGNLKVMDLCYCPFEKTCKDCDKKDVYTLTDENGRVFPVRRFVRADGSCRFEVFNCADLVGSGTAVAGRLIDATLIGDPSAWERALDDEEKQKRLTEHYTQGHHYKSVN